MKRWPPYFAVSLLAGLMSCGEETPQPEAGGCRVYTLSGRDDICVCNPGATDGTKACPDRFRENAQSGMLCVTSSGHQQCVCQTYGCEGDASSCSCWTGQPDSLGGICAPTTEHPLCCATLTSCECQSGTTCPGRKVASCSWSDSPPALANDGECVRSVPNCTDDTYIPTGCGTDGSGGSGGSSGGNSSGAASGRAGTSAAAGSGARAGGAGTGSAGGPALCTPKGGECEHSSDCACGEGCLKTSTCETCLQYCIYPCETDADCVEWSKGLTSPYLSCHSGSLFSWCQ